MKRLILTLLACSTLLMACNSESASEKGNTTDIFTKVYSVANLETQTFTIDNSTDHNLTGKSGTKIRINKNSFVDASGKAVMGKIEIQLKEALTPSDMVLGNLTTVFEGRPLETGGMIYLNAQANHQDLMLGDGKTIGVTIPTKSALSKMSLFEGKADSSGVKWGNPVQLAKPKELKDKDSLVITKKTTNIHYSVDGFPADNDDNYPQEVVWEVARIAWAGDGVKIKRDSVFKVGKYTVRFNPGEITKHNDTLRIQKGKNAFMEDKNTNYIFSMKKLGWANIDRLLFDPRTKPVELVTAVENQADFALVYVSLVTKNMYLPGYQKKDGTYGFSHDDNEQQRLPVGENATILATAYKDGKPYFALQKITISEKADVAMTLVETTTEKLKGELFESLN